MKYLLLQWCIYTQLHIYLTECLPYEPFNMLDAILFSRPKFARVANFLKF